MKEFLLSWGIIGGIVGAILFGALDVIEREDSLPDMLRQAILFQAIVYGVLFGSILGILAGLFAFFFFRPHK